MRSMMTSQQRFKSDLEIIKKLTMINVNHTLHSVKTFANDTSAEIIKH